MVTGISHTMAFRSAARTGGCHVFCFKGREHLMTPACIPALFNLSLTEDEGRLGGSSQLSETGEKRTPPLYEVPDRPSCGSGGGCVITKTCGNVPLPASLSPKPDGGLLLLAQKQYAIKTAHR